MSDLQDFIAKESGIVLHRKRTLTAFSHLPDSPLMNVLYGITRPPLRATQPDVANKPAQPAAPPIVVRRGMVNYRRELYGITHADPDPK